MTDQAVTKSDEVAQLIELRHRVDKNKPKADDAAEFRKGLTKFPDLWRAFGDMVLKAEHKLIDAINVPNSSREAMRLGVKSVKDDLVYASAPPLEKMLIDQVALCWLKLSIVELKHATITSANVGISQGDYWDRTLSAGQRRYMRAIETLARVRQLRKPNAVQVNIGAQQVNVANIEKKDAV